jgi:hypothetical protein
LHGNPFLLNRLQCLEKKSKPLKRFTNFLLSVSPG